MGSKRPWIKLYERWLTSPRHAGLSGDVLGTGALLLLMAESMGEDGADGTRWLLCPDGAPAVLATCHRCVRVRPVSCRRRVREMLRVGTMIEREDGCLGFPNYKKWQENPSAERMRRHRARSAEAVTGDREAEERSRGKRKEAEVDPPHPLDPAWAEVSAVCDRLPWVGNGLPKLLSPRDRIHRLVGRGATADEIVRTLEGFATAVREGKELRKHWSAQYVFSGHYDRLRVEYGQGTEDVGDKIARLRAERGG